MHFLSRRTAYQNRSMTDPGQYILRRHTPTDSGRGNLGSSLAPRSLLRHHRLSCAASRSVWSFFPPRTPEFRERCPCQGARCLSNLHDALHDGLENHSIMFTNLGCSRGRDLGSLHTGGRAGIHDSSSGGQVDSSHRKATGLVLQNQRAILIKEDPFELHHHNPIIFLLFAKGKGEKRERERKKERKGRKRKGGKRN